MASIWVSGGHIMQGTVKLNDTYFNTTKYNTPAWKNLMMCQEVGRTLGLAHQDENFDNANLGTYTDYTNDPLSNRHPNTHNYQELESIYSAHTDSSNTYGNTSAANRLPAAARDIDPSDTAQRVRLIHRSAGGRAEIYERGFGGGHKVITWVIRAVEGSPVPETTGPRARSGTGWSWRGAQPLRLANLLRHRRG
ncbi:MAG: hypothetical protein M3305_09700, partial [Actinomycetota bacterium]|nr:hypothetical protein [Actinomycetota bacterium]